MEKLKKKQAQLEILADLIERLDVIIRNNEEEVRAIEEDEDVQEWRKAYLDEYKRKIEEARELQKFLEKLV